MIMQDRNKRIKNETWNVDFDARRKHKQWLITDKGDRFIEPSRINMRLIGSAPKMYVLLRHASDALAKKGIEESLRVKIDVCLGDIVGELNNPFSATMEEGEIND